MKYIRLIFIISLLIIATSCLPRAYRVAAPNITILKQSSKLVGDFLGNPNDENGHYIILNNTIHTYHSHWRTEEEVGLWRRNGDTLFLEPQLLVKSYGQSPGKYHDCIGERIPLRYLFSGKYAYDITDYESWFMKDIKDMPDSLLTEPFWETTKMFNDAIDETREVMLIMYDAREGKMKRIGR